MTNKQIIEISTPTILKFILIILGLVFLYFIRDILLILFVAIIISSAVDAPVDWLVKRRVRRVLGVALVYLFVALVFGLLLLFIVPPLAEQVKLLANNLPEYLDKLNSVFSLIQEKSINYNASGFLDRFGSQLSGWASNLFSATASVFGGLISFFLIIAISVYLSAEEKGVKKFFVSITPEADKVYVASLVDRIQAKFGAWVRGQIVLSLVIGVMVFVGLSILKIKYALVLALIAALLEVIPYLGPFISAALGIALAFTQSPILALIAAILYYVIQEFENLLIVPQIMKRVTGLNPVVIIISVLIGAKLAGILGIIIAVPLAAGLSVFLNDIIFEKKV
ncbi:MAG: hypothetical protein UV40_C0044G0002 [Parcubacteria group bacterium GW2011_GWA1_42_7]|nr:MAG: hypothetical protein UV34_C0010G0013 [Parcubacteria group bacterium GW2011_GWB1_42_6]KKS68809.1 MAG: hypothetical protein UV40_C0044G0002 [Parcubacteria group bacterium GW2011_GWA1_42_7]